MLILASSSPRRRALLDLLDVAYRVEAAEIDETILPGETPKEAVERLALGKAGAVANSHPGQWVLGADTVVALDQTILGKPSDASDAVSMLSSLSGKTHQVHTGMALILKNKLTLIDQSHTSVRFRRIERKEISAYVATGEPFGKAGAYAVQGLGGSMVAAIEGELSTVVGLTLSSTMTLLGKAGIPHAMT